MTFREDVKEMDDIVDKLTKGPVQFSQDSLPFKYDSTELASPSANQQLAELAKAMSSPQIRKIRFKIEDHTCDKGTSSHNQSLSENRALAIAAALKASGVDADRIEVEGFGESKPAAPNTTPENRSRNRRVVLSRM